MRTEAFTDNKGNDFILKRGLSTKYPLTLMVMEVSEMLRKDDSSATLTWVRRDENQEADDLTNQEYGKFDSRKRVEVNKDTISWIVMDRLLESSSRPYEDIKNLKEEKKRKKATDEGGGKKGKFFSRWSS